MKLTHLRVNHRQNPLGIDGAPEFSWRIESDRQNALQKRYRICVAEGGKTVWDSGERESRLQSFIRYDGEPLRTCTAYTWHLTVWDNSGEAACADGEFETGFSGAENWQAKWIESTIPRQDIPLFAYGVENPAVVFSRSFILPEQVCKARLYATAYGCYRVSVNGQRPDERELAPEFTPYNHSLNYQCYDVTALLHKGANTLEMLAGDGWFFCPQTAVRMDTPHEAPAVLFQLHYTLAGGRIGMLGSDGSETVRTSQIVFTDLFMGEKLDLTREEGAPQAVAIRDYGYTQLRAQPVDPVQAVEKLPAKAILQTPEGDTLVDFGQIICGRARIRIDAPRGTQLQFEYTEAVDKAGNYFSASAIRQCDVLVSDGIPRLYEAVFTFHGFRYIRVRGMKEVSKDDFTAVLLSTPKENAGSFSCSDARLNRLYQNIRYSQKNNMLSIPTDCPTREKAGWTGDILIYAPTAIRNEEMTPFLLSWLDGLAAEQRENGVLPIISPLTALYEKGSAQFAAAFGDTGLPGVAGWSDAIVWVPYALYRATGNPDVLRRYFEPMKRWCDYIVHTANTRRGSELPERTDRWLWNTGFHFGEWLIPGQPSEGLEVCKESAGYIAPFFGYRTLRVFAEICFLLNRAEYSEYSDYAEHMKQAIVDGFLTPGHLPKHLMGAYVLAFAFGLVPEALYPQFTAQLRTLLDDADDCVGTGFLATPFLLDVAEALYGAEAALRILMQTKQPSWLFEVEQGATAIWENWFAFSEQGEPQKCSFDHYAFGCVDEWICRRLCGIDAAKPGFSHIQIRPMDNVPFDWSRTFVCEAGAITVTRTGETLSVTIPPNTTGTVSWHGNTCEIGSGSHTFG